MANENDFYIQGSLSYMAETFRLFDMARPDWGEEQHIAHAVTQINPHDLMRMLEKDFQARKEGGDNIAMFICGVQGTGKSLVANYFTNTLSKIWGTTFR